MLEALTGRFGDSADALVIDGTALSWETIGGWAAELATRISGADAVAVTMRPDPGSVAALLGGLLAGVPVVPIAADAGDGERSHILSTSKAFEIDAISAAIVARPARVAPSSLAALPDDQSPALILYTSGTTGPPKGVVLSRRATSACIDGLADAWAWSPDDVLAHGLPLFHGHGLVLGLLGPLRVGCKLRHTGRPTPTRYAAAAADSTMFFGVPTVWSRIVAEPDKARALARSRLLISGSATLPRPVFDALSELCGQLPIERYGMTETLITISIRADGERRPGSVGLPIKGMSSRIVDEAGEMIRPDGQTIGSLQMRGPTLFNGYLGQPEETANALVDGWMDTGDSATISPDGFHSIIGRTSIDIMKSGGFKVGAGEVEASLLGHGSVAEVAVLGIPDDDLGDKITAFVVLSDQSSVSGSELIQHVADDLSIHKRPREIRFVDELPRNALGKVNKQLLRDS